MKRCRHKFQPRFTKRWSTALKDLVNTSTGIKTNDQEELVESYLAEKTYIHDICVRCGTIRKELK